MSKRPCAKPQDDRAPFVSIIILNFNGERYLVHCLSSVLGTKYPNFEVILVDNASTDQSVDLVMKTFGSDGRLKIIRNPENFGFSQGNNIGLKHARGEYIVFLNNDTIVDPYWLVELVCSMQADRTIGLSQSILLTIDGKLIQSAGGLYSNNLVIQFQFLAGNKFRKNEFPSSFEVSYANGCSMVIERRFLERIGAFERRLPFFYDDTLLSLKTWLAGRRVVTVTQSKVRHVGGGTHRNDSYFIAYHSCRARICLIFNAYLKLCSLTKALFAFITSLTGNALFALRLQDLQQFQGYINAVGWVLRNLKFIWKNRIILWSKSRISPELLLTKFERIKIPTAICLLPSRLQNVYCLSEVNKYRNSLTRTTR